MFESLQVSVSNASSCDIRALLSAADVGNICAPQAAQNLSRDDFQTVQFPRACQDQEPSSQCSLLSLISVLLCSLLSCSLTTFPACPLPKSVALEEKKAGKPEALK